jgi:hypothetical protein
MRLIKSAKILFGSTEVPCTINKLSKLGACLILQTTHGIPALFVLTMPNQASRTCKVTWRDDKRLGVHFKKGSLPSPIHEVIK